MAASRLLRPTSSLASSLASSLTLRSCSTAPAQRVGLVGMGHVGEAPSPLSTYPGTAVAHNLLRKGFLVSAITDIKPELCHGFPSSVQVTMSPPVKHGFCSFCTE